MKALALPAGRAWLRERWSALAPRERRFLAGGAGAGLIFLLVLMLRPAPGGAAIEFAAPSAPHAPPIVPTPPAPTHAAPPPAPPAASLASGLLLRGVLASGAIIALPAGGERIVTLGRDVMPGLRLKSVGVRHAILGGSGD